MPAHHRVAGALAALVVLAACAPAHSAGQGGGTRQTPPASSTATTIPAFSHVFIIVMENESASAIYGNYSAPYFNQLAQQYAAAMDYFAVSHPSLPNYIALTSGTSTNFDGTDCTVGNDCHVSGNNSNIADKIEASGRTWTAYMESMPAPCALQNAGTYAVRHNPFVYYDDIRDGSNNRCATHDVPYDQADFATTLANGPVPNFVWITPNLCDDGHDACGGDPIANSDAWLAQNVPPILGSNAFQQGGVLFITWDEGTGDDACCGLNHGGGQVAMLVISPLARRAYRSSGSYTHFSLLRTIEESWHLSPLSNPDPSIQSAVHPMGDFFNPST